MIRDDDVPLMCAGSVSGAPHPAGLAIRRLGPDEAALHVRVAAAGFDAPPAVFAAVMTERMLAAEGMRAYVGEVDGEAVATAVALTHAGTVGIFNGATLPPHRRRGDGAAITAQAARDGLADGARYAWLQSTPMGVRVYESVGFRTLESWRCWVTPPPATPEPVGSAP